MVGALLTSHLRQERALKTLHKLVAAGVVAAAATAPAMAADISGAGSTFAYPIYSKWAEAYKKETGIGVNYQSIGSGDGISQIQNKEVTFAGSDMPLSVVDLDTDGLLQFPMLTAGVVPVVNLDGIKPGDLVLDGLTLARIFLGEIKSWNDAAIRKLNPSAKLPSQAIAVVHRSDGSGTTFVFTDYLGQGEPGLAVESRIDYRRRLAGRHRRQGQRRRRRQRCPDQGCNRLRRICLCQAEQAHLCQAAEQGWQGGCAHHRVVQRRCRQRELGGSARLRRDPHQ
jgi:ABC-type phosphate transport system substrate-binding protein